MALAVVAGWRRGARAPRRSRAPAVPARWRSTTCGSSPTTRATGCSTGSTPRPGRGSAPTGWRASPTRRRRAGSPKGTSSSSASTAVGLRRRRRPRPADESSTTNTQEPGIGEPDLAWTDGHRLVTVVTGRLRGRRSRPRRGDGDGRPLRPRRAASPPVGLLVDGDHAVVIEGSSELRLRRARSPAAASPRPCPSTARRRPDSSASTSAPPRRSWAPSPSTASTSTPRMIDGVVRTVVRSSPAELGFVYPSGNGQAAIDRADGRQPPGRSRTARSTTGCRR